jgi:hypothetical protein
VKARTAVVVAVVAVALLGASYFLFFVRPERAVEPPPPPAPETLRLSAATGVEIAGSDGVWRAASAGERLSARDRIRTDDDGAAELLAADGSSVHLGAATQARVDELRRELKRLSLGTGELSADVRDDPARVFEVALDDQGAVARTRGAAFSANSDGKGNAALATRRGEVILSARGKEVVIRSGQFARLARGEQPRDATPIPQSLFLKVTWPPTSTNRKAVTVKGVTDPNARVKVAGHYVPVEANGRYSVDIPLPDGIHRLDVQASDVAGHIVDEKSPKILVDTTTDFTVHPPNWK